MKSTKFILGIPLKVNKNIHHRERHILLPEDDMYEYVICITDEEHKHHWEMIESRQDDGNQIY